ncbi:MAG TPA: class I SAM-dependent DNA methyltransferase [Thermoanaerobaculia bacterium]|jgi:type I restriction enzyme M protein|nr:class I SAM-dependent DNA methyltransferase [Thermoanaerobaculia bacterium]
MANHSQTIVQKLWSYCNILRDDGLSYPEYVEQLTYLLFLKMSHEQASTSTAKPLVPPGFDWLSLKNRRGSEQHAHYGEILRQLALGPGMLGLIFRNAENKIRDPEKLGLLINDLIDKENWSALDADVKGDAYEGLLEKNAQDTKSGAGQYFTPRPVIRAIVEVTRPTLGETICDPACGTCGFLLAAYEYLRQENVKLSLSQEKHLRLNTFRGVELVAAVARLGAMNLLLHGIGPHANEAPPPIRNADSLAFDDGDRFDLVLTNPPFGKKSSITVVNDRGERERQTLTLVRDDFWASTSNKQLNFVQHVYTILRPGGRAAMVVPDNVLFEGGAGELIRRKLLHDCDVHTLLRLPTGIFYAQGVKANVLFFDKKPSAKKPATSKLWIYDLRSNFHVTLKENPIQRTDLDEFVHCFKAERFSRRTQTWSEQNPSGRWRSFSYSELMTRDKCSLDISWIKDDSIEEFGQLPDPATLAAEIVEDLRASLDQLEEIAEDLVEHK